MNIIKLMLSIAALATVLFATVSCDNTKNNHHQSDDMLHSEVNETQMPNGNMQHTHSCAMHPEHTGIKGGKCSECGMDLEEMSTDMLNQNHMQMIMKDSTMMHNMMGHMMNNPTMMGSMMQRMHKEGMMSQECMQSGMKIMGNKGWDQDNMMQDGSMKKH